MSFSCVVGYLTTTTQHLLFGQSLEGGFSETQSVPLLILESLYVGVIVCAADRYYAECTNNFPV